MKELVVLDSCVAGYLVVPRPKKGQDQQAADSIRLVTEGRHRFILPTPALAEVLAQLPESQHDRAMQDLSRLASVQIRAFDTLAAMRAGTIPVPAPAGSATKQQVKVDVQIAACALRYGAVAVCTYNLDDFALILKNATPAVRISDPPRFLEQVPLFAVVPRKAP